MQPTVSIIIPTYNDGPLIKEAVESVLRQTFPVSEIIIVNDGSNDKTSLEVLSSLTNNPIITQYHQENLGLPAARNKAIAHSSGKFILPLDADDTLEETFVEKALKVILDNTSVKAVSSWARKFGEDQGVIKLKGGDLKDFIADNPTTASSIFRKSDWEALGGFDENMRTGYEDWEFWIRMLDKGGKIVVLEEPLFNYRIKSTSMAVSSGENRYRIMEYMIHKNLPIYQRYTAEAILSSENLLQKEKMIWKARIEKVYQSKSYRLGHCLLSPLRIFKKGQRS